MSHKLDKANQLDKQKDKIRKLLELSLSDNENEASIALKQAMSLMNAHNITKDEVYGQNMANKVITTPYYRIPDWYVTLHNTMAKVSGCFCVYRNGDSFFEELATIQITGRQRDVDNAEYLIVFLSREVEKSIKQYKQQLAQQGIKSQLSARVKAYRMGFISKVYKKMYECQNQFFSHANKGNAKTNTASGTEMVCIDLASRVSEAKTYYTDVLGQTFARASSQARYISSSMNDGSKAAEQLSINQAVNQQESIKGLGIL
ncbi:MULTISPECIES: DUF2786 domain-containing protein [Cysteiniphilum]|uniref:DUF2786 domain-containing protein n=1 Tax=Cysteiniphilum TaxID=2056696 RepID=UPI00177C87D2|nr:MULTISPECIES: DUF2786 domain-containing protein [Cysteiniphilum]